MNKYLQTDFFTVCILPLPALYIHANALNTFPTTQFHVSRKGKYFDFKQQIFSIIS